MSGVYWRRRRGYQPINHGAAASRQPQPCPKGREAPGSSNNNRIRVDGAGARELGGRPLWEGFAGGGGVCDPLSDGGGGEAAAFRGRIDGSAGIGLGGGEEGGFHVGGPGGRFFIFLTMVSFCSVDTTVLCNSTITTVPGVSVLLLFRLQVCSGKFDVWVYI